MQKRGGKAIEMLFNSARPHNTGVQPGFGGEEERGNRLGRFQSCVWSQSQAP